MIRRTVDYLKDVRNELSQVSWSPLPELWDSTRMVLVAVAGLALIIGLFDLVCAELVSLLIR